MSTNKPFSEEHFLSGGGVMGQLMREKNWGETPLGAPINWPRSLKTCVRIVLTSRQPMFVWWGKQLTHIAANCRQVQR